MRSVSSSCGSMNDVGLVGKVYRVSRPLVSQRRMVEGSRSQRVAASLTVMRSLRRLGSVAFMGVPYLAVHARATRALVRIGMHGWACAAWRVRRRSVAPPSRRLRGWVRVRWSRPPFWSGVRSALVRGLWWSHVDRGASSRPGQSVQVWRTSRSGVLPQVAGATPGRRLAECDWIRAEFGPRGLHGVAQLGNVSVRGNGPGGQASTTKAPPGASSLQNQPGPRTTR